jgi:hypothetical protein
MQTDQPIPATMDAYIAGFPQEVQAILQQVRKTIRDAAPDARETINYGIPTFTLPGSSLVHSPPSKAHQVLSRRRGSSSSGGVNILQERPGLGHSRWISPSLNLIARIVAFRVENLARNAKGGGCYRRRDEHSMSALPWHSRQTIGYLVMSGAPAGRHADLAR